MTVIQSITIPAAHGPGSLAISANGAVLAAVLWRPDSNQPGSDLLFIDTNSNAVTKTIQGGLINLESVSPDGKTVYLLEPSGDLETADVATGIVKSVITGEPISATYLSPDGKTVHVFLGNGFTGNVDDSDGVIAFREGSTAGKVLAVGQPSSWLALSANGEILYSAGPNGVWSVSTATGQVLSKMAAALNVAAVAVSPHGSTLYAFSTQSSSFTILNAFSGTVEKTILLPSCTSGPLGSIALTLAGDHAFVNSCGSVLSIDLATQLLEPGFPGLTGPGLAVSPSGRFLYAAAGTSVDVFSISTKQQAGTIAMTANAIVFSPDGTQAYIAGSQNGVRGVGVIDTSTLAILDFVNGGQPCYFGCGAEGGESISITPDGRFLSVASATNIESRGSAVIKVIDTQSLQVVAQLISGAPIVTH